MTKEETWKKLVILGAVFGSMPPGKWRLSESSLSKAKLNGAFLSRATLSKADLSGAFLRESKLRGARLIGANLSKADLGRADIRSANLTKANLSQTGFVESNLSGANLSKANLSGAFLKGAFLNRADLRSADLRGADLSGASLVDADVRGANLSGAFLRCAFLNRADLSNTDLSGADLFGVTFFGAKLLNSCLTLSRIVNVNFNNCDLSGADITGAFFWGISNTGWKIDGIKVSHIFFTRDAVNKEKHKRTFKKGQFEALFKSFPTIELIFENGLSVHELWILNAIIEDIKKNKPNFGLKLANVSMNDFQTAVGINTAKDEYLEKATSLILNKLAMGGFIENILPYFNKRQPISGMDSSSLEPYIKQPLTISQNITINLIKGDGSIVQSSPNAKIEYGKLIHNYQRNEAEIERLFDDLKDFMSELKESTRIAIQESIEQLTEVLREGTDVGRAQKLWNEVKEGVKVSGSGAGIISALTKLLGM